MKCVLSIIIANLFIPKSIFAASTYNKELKTVECYSSVEYGPGDGVRYLLYKKYAGVNSNTLAQEQDIQVVIGNMAGESLKFEKFKLISKESSFNGFPEPDSFGNYNRFLIIDQNRNDPAKTIKIILDSKEDSRNPFIFYGYVSSNDYSYNLEVSNSLNCWVSDGEAN